MSFRAKMPLNCKNLSSVKNTVGVNIVTTRREGSADSLRCRGFYRGGVFEIRPRIQTASWHHYVVVLNLRTFSVRYFHSQIHLRTVCRFFTIYVVDDIGISRFACLVSVFFRTHLIMTIAAVFQICNFQLRLTSGARRARIRTRFKMCVIRRNSH